MNRLDDVLKIKHLDPEAKEELKEAKQSVKDLRALANVATSEGGEQLLNMLQEDCRDLLLKMMNAKSENKTENVLIYLSDFEAKFTLFNTIKSAPSDYSDSDEALDAHLDEILKGLRRQ